MVKKSVCKLKRKVEMLNVLSMTRIMISCVLSIVSISCAKKESVQKEVDGHEAVIIYGEDRPISSNAEGETPSHEGQTKTEEEEEPSSDILVNLSGTIRNLNSTGLEIGYGDKIIAIEPQVGSDRPYMLQGVHWEGIGSTVEVLSHPHSQYCSVQKLENEDYLFDVWCHEDIHPVKFIVKNLETKTIFVLNGSEEMTVDGEGEYTFLHSVAHGSPVSVVEKFGARECEQVSEDFSVEITVEIVCNPDKKIYVDAAGVHNSVDLSLQIEGVDELSTLTIEQDGEYYFDQMGVRGKNYAINVVDNELCSIAEHASGVYTTDLRVSLVCVKPEPKYCLSTVPLTVPIDFTYVNVVRAAAKGCRDNIPDAKKIVTSVFNQERQKMIALEENGDKKERKLAKETLEHMSSISSTPLASLGIVVNETE